MLPDIDGLSLCQHIRTFSCIPIIIISGKVTAEDNIMGLNAGADDYITKPFSTEILKARVRAALRRSEFNKGHEALFKYQDLEIDFITKIVTVSDHKIDLSATEYRLLVLLAENADRVVASEEILAHLWGHEHSRDLHLVRVNIARVRNWVMPRV